MSIGMSKVLVIGISLLVCILLQSEEIHGKEYVVGDDKGWIADPSISHWPEGKHFKAGDILNFKYTDPLMAVIVLMHEEFYKNCDAYPDMKKGYNSGDDHVVLEEGTNYFIPVEQKYCEKGVKIKVTVE